MQDGVGKVEGLVHAKPQRPGERFWSFSEKQRSEARMNDMRGPSQSFCYRYWEAGESLGLGCRSRDGEKGGSQGA